MPKLYRATYKNLLTGHFSYSESGFDSDEEARADALAQSQFPLQITRLSILDYNTRPPTLLDVKLFSAQSLPDITVTEREIYNANCPSKPKD